MAGALRKTMVYLGLAEDDDRFEPYVREDEDGVPAPRDEEDEDDRRAPVTPINRGQVARVVPVAPETSLHEPPEALHCSHW